jgi:hypothetical protein
LKSVSERDVLSRLLRRVTGADIREESEEARGEGGSGGGRD